MKLIKKKNMKKKKMKLILMKNMKNKKKILMILKIKPQLVITEILKTIY